MIKILISVGHPADVHLFKNLIWTLEKKGHEIKIIARNKEVCINLLESYGFDYNLISNAGSGLFGLGIEMISRVLKLIPLIINFNPDLILSMMDPSVAISAKILGKKYISFADTEHATFIIKSVLPLTDAVLTPSCFKKELGKKQIRYAGYHELAYLHPNYFTPNPEVLSELELAEGDKFIILRFVSFGAHHDIGHKTLNLEDKLRAVHEFEKYGRVLITSEKKLPLEFEKYIINLSPEKIHHLLYYAVLLYGDSATMASECAVLGTHAIFCYYTGIGYTDEQEEKYALVYNFSDEGSMGKESFAKALELLSNPKLKEEGKQKREQLLADKIDVTDFIVNFVEKSVGN
jgi:predicted glycosyltransferase